MPTPRARATSRCKGPMEGAGIARASSTNSSPRRRETPDDRVSSEDLAASRRDGSPIGRHLGLLGASAGHPGRGAQRRTLLRHAADRGDLQPGQPVRRLHRHAARRFCPSRPAHRGRGEASDRKDHLRRRSPWSKSLAQGSMPTRRWRRPKRWSRPMSRPVSARSTSMPRWDAPASRPRSTTPRPRSARRGWPWRPSARQATAGGEPPVYVIGTEVPPPGGADHVDRRLEPTSCGGGAGTRSTFIATSS